MFLYHIMYFVIGNNSVTLIQEPSVLFEDGRCHRNKVSEKVGLQNPLFVALLMYFNKNNKNLHQSNLGFNWLLINCKMSLTPSSRVLEKLTVTQPI
jgi:hypothetical protein